MKTSIPALIRKVLHRSNLGGLLLLLSLPPFFFYVGPASASPALVIIDTLGAATPSTQFSVFGSGGTTITSDQFVGPEFVLNQPTVITEIGAFINNCGTIISGVPLCPNALPILVEIRPATNGLPDSTTILATFVLPDDNDPLRISYESVTMHLTLGSGTYFAIFATQGIDGSLLGNASDPFVYQAGLVDLGVLGPAVGGAVVNRGFPAAVRILGLPAPQEVNIDIKPGSASNVINTQSEGKIRVAILSTATFDAPSLVDKNSLTFGKTGYETTLAFCDKGALDVNHDGRPDVVCFFYDHGAGFQSGDGAGILNGLTTSGAAFTGSDSIRIVP